MKRFRQLLIASLVAGGVILTGNISDVSASGIANTFNKITNLYQKDGTMITNRALRGNTPWRVGKIIDLEGVQYYQVATNEYLKATDASYVNAAAGQYNPHLTVITFSNDEMTPYYDDRTNQVGGWVNPGSAYKVNRVIKNEFNHVYYQVTGHGWVVAGAVNTSGYPDNIEYVPGFAPMGKGSDITPSLEVRLKAKWKNILANVGNPVDIAVYDSNTQQSYSVSTNDGAAYYNASIVKVAILTQVLHNGNVLSDAQRNAAANMIINSNNDAATYFYQNVLSGPNDLNNMYRSLGMTGSWADNAWGLTTTRASDQVKLLNEIFYTPNYLSADSQAYIKSLMGSVSGYQRWGVSAANGQNQLKNGWLNYGNGWIINSIGHLGADNGGYTLSILTNGNYNQTSGQQLVERLATATGQVLN